MESAVYTTIRPRLLTIGIAAALLCLAGIGALESELAPALPLGITVGLLVAVSFVTSILAIGHEERLQPRDAAWEEADHRPYDEEEGVRSYRYRRLRKLGISDELAAFLAGSRTVSVHELAGLVENGCPPPLAVRILWPH